MFISLPIIILIYLLWPHILILAKPERMESNFRKGKLSVDFIYI